MKRNFFSDLRRFSQLCANHRGELWLAGILSGLLGGTLGVICQAQALKFIIAYFFEKQQSAFAQALLMIGATLVIGFVLQPLTQYWSSVTVSKIASNMRLRLFDHLTALPVSYFTNSHSGDVVARLNGDVDAFSGACDTVMSFLGAVIPMLTVIPYMMTLDMRMAGIIAAIGIAFLILTAKVIAPLRKRQKQIRGEMAKMSVTATESITGFHIIKTNNLEDRFGEKFKKDAKDLYETQIKFGNLNAIIGFFNIFIWCGGEAITAVCGLLFVLGGTLAVADLSALVTVSRNVINVFTNFSSLPVQLQQAFAGVDRIYELLDVAAEPTRYEVACAAPAGSGLSFKDIRFSYDGIKDVLNGVTVRVEKGQTIALVGDSGSGKSTLAKIIAGLLCPGGGEISVFGRPFCDYTLEQYRSMVAYVPQNAYVFDGSIAENIGYGKKGSTLEQIISAAQKADAHAFIMQKPDQYDTTVGERGIRLSGGERQRLAIARAILKNADILLLDEATSSLDSESESAIQNTLDVLLKEHTSVVIAHRLSTIVNADRIFFMQNGNIIGSGSHQELLAGCREYEELYYKKFASAAPESIS